MTKQQLFENAMALPKDQRIDLAMDLWATIDPEDVPLTQEMRDELDRRIAEFDANPSSGIPWSEVRAQLLRNSQ